MKQYLTILGGGAAGLLTALLLRQRYQHIQIIDRHLINANGESQGLPQTEHLHILLAKGQTLFASLLPEVWQQLNAVNLPVVDWADETYWLSPQGLIQTHEHSLKTVLFSRRRLNKILINSSLACDNIAFLKMAVVNWDCLNGRIATFRDKANQSIEVPGDVIDVRGRGSQLAKQLSLKEKWVKNNYQYYSCRLAMSDWSNYSGRKQIYLQPNLNKRPLGLVISPIEDNDCLLTLIDSQGALDCKADKLPVVNELLGRFNLGGIANHLYEWRPYGNLYNYRVSINRRKWPKNLLALGDSLSFQNPVYGQGLTVILKQLAYLNKQAEISYQTQKAINQINYFSWQLAKHQDSFSVRSQCFKAVFNYLLKRSTHSPFFASQFMKALHHMSLRGKK